MSCKTNLLNELSKHQGREKGIRADFLAERIGCSQRILRKLISQCRFEDGHAICGHPHTGYYMATTPEELQDTCRFLEKRAMHSLIRLSRMKNVSLPDLLGQLKLNQA